MVNFIRGVWERNVNLRIWDKGFCRPCFAMIGKKRANNAENACGGDMVI